MVDAIRFFRVVPPVPSLMMTAFVIVTLTSVVAIAVDPMHTRGTLTAVIVLQAFACSSGFAGHARRGHYDLLLTRGDRRSVIGAVHCVMSSLPGIASWIVISAAEAVVTGTPRVGFASGTAAAVTSVSTIAWALTVPLPRFAGAIGWLVTVAMGIAVTSADAIPSPISAIVYPVGLVGGSLARDPASAAAALSASLASVVVALVWFERGDIRLESAQ